MLDLSQLVRAGAFCIRLAPSRIDPSFSVRIALDVAQIARIHVAWQLNLVLSWDVLCNS